MQRSWKREGRPPSLIVSLLGTVPPGPAMPASGCSVSLGTSADGERAASAIRWWRTVTGLDLVHIGDWHKHNARLPVPSPGDHLTAKEMSRDSSLPVWLAAIAVKETAEEVETGVEENSAYVTHSAAGCEHVGFYRASPAKGLVPMPVLIEPDALPSLPPLPWHVADPARFAAECRLLAAAGVGVAIEPSGSRARPGLVLRLRPDGKPGVTAITGPGYPNDPPVLRGADFKRLNGTGPWSAGRFLVDLFSDPQDEER